MVIYCLIQIVKLETENQSEKQQQNEASISTALIITLVLLFLDWFLHSKMEKLQKKYPTLSFIQHSLITLSIGILAGLCLNRLEIKAVGTTIKKIFEPLFMIVLLPPILYSSVLTMDKYYFFKNLSCILLFAILGTLLTIIVHSLLFFLY